MFCRHHHNGRWEARIGRVFGNKYLYLGTYGKLNLHKHKHTQSKDRVKLLSFISL